MHAVSLLARTADIPPFQGPGIGEFFPPAVLFAGTWFEINRVMLVRFTVVIAIILLFWIGTRRMRVVPGRFQSVIEMGMDFVRVSLAEDILGKKDGRRFLPLIMAVFFTVLVMNFAGVVPGLNVAGTAVIGLPGLMTLFAYVAFIYAGCRRSGWGFFRNALFPPGVPWYFYPVISPLEFISTFLVRPFTLTLRLMMNMIVGHLLIVLFFSATQWFFFSVPGILKVIGAGTLAFGFAFTVFELLIIVLQAYIFALLTTVYIQLALLEEH
jgi:F-type H+-transporting ATPase subunit a